MRVLGDRQVWVVAISSRAGGEHLEDQGVGGVGEQANTSVEKRCSHPSSHLDALDQVTGGGDDQGVLALVLGVVVEVVYDTCALLVRLEADLAGHLPQSLAQVGVAGHQDVAALVDELGDRLGADGATELLDSGSEDDQVIVEELAIFLQNQPRVVRHFESELEAAAEEGLEVDRVRLFDCEVLQQNLGNAELGDMILQDSKSVIGLDIQNA